LTTDSTPRAVNPGSLPPPRGFSHGTLSGNTLYLGGQTALDQNMQIVPGDLVAQFRQAFGNLLATLSEVGGIPADLVNITLFLTDIPDSHAHRRQVGEDWRELAGST
jgi:enamine deaminase RidA (YjgF/YER057c/UK114 family)